MPIYEYECKKCGHHIEVFQKFSDDPLTKCERCRGKLRKLISQNAFHLKGTGWYVTDYASKGSSCTRSVKEKDSSSKESKKTEAKPGKESSSSPKSND